MTAVEITTEEMATRTASMALSLARQGKLGIGAMFAVWHGARYLDPNVSRMLDSTDYVSCAYLRQSFEDYVARPIETSQSGTYPVNVQELLPTWRRVLDSIQFDRLNYDSFVIFFLGHTCWATKP